MKLMKSEKYKYKKRIYIRIYIHLKKKLIFIFFSNTSLSKEIFQPKFLNSFFFKFKLTKLLKLSKMLLIIYAIIYIYNILKHCSSGSKNRIKFDNKISRLTRSKGNEKQHKD